MPQPTMSQVHVNRPLTNIAVAYLQDQADFIAGKVFPNVPVANQSDRYFSYSKQQWFRTDAKERGVSQESAGSGFEIDNTPSYSCTVKAVHKDVDDQIRANSDTPIAPDRDATEFVTRQLLLRMEKDWQAKYFTTGVWTGSSTGTDIVPGTKWDNASGTPIVDIRAQRTAVRKNTGFDPNTLVLAADVWAAIQDSSDFLDRIAITRDKIVTPQLLASVLELDNVYIAKAVEDTAKENATASMNYVFTDDALLVYSAPRPGILQPTGGYTFSWTNFLGATANGLRVKRFRIEEIASDRVEGEMAYDQKLVGADLGAFFNGCLT